MFDNDFFKTILNSPMLSTVMFCVYFLLFISVTVGFMIQPVWSTATPARSGFVMGVETHQAGKIQSHISFFFFFLPSLLVYLSKLTGRESFYRYNIFIAGAQ